MTTALARLEDTPQEVAYRFSAGLYRCAVCGAWLDGESRFWCRLHYRFVSLFTIRAVLSPSTVKSFEQELKRVKAGMRRR